jgi:hypothetical protein
MTKSAAMGVLYECGSLLRPSDSQIGTIREWGGEQAGGREGAEVWNEEKIRMARKVLRGRVGKANRTLGSSGKGGRGFGVSFGLVKKCSGAECGRDG